MITAAVVGFTIGLLLKTTVVAQQNVSFLNGLPENFTSDGAIDVQYTSCKVITDRIVATAEGKFSRFCHGICNINETNARLHRIESLLTADAENIKQRLFHMERILLSGQIISKTSAGAAVDTDRLREIGTYNGTVSTVEDGSVAGSGRPRGLTTAFVYYWRVDAFWRLSFGADGLARSPPFYVSPRSYRISLSVHSDLTARTVRVAAEPVAGEYDAQLRWPFAHRLRLSVLDQTDVGPEDIVSRIWDDVRCTAAEPPTPPPHQNPSQNRGHRQPVAAEAVCASMEFRHDVLTYRRYAAGDSIVVKLTVFMQQ
ncbi:uncharacterized protein LOC132924675 [Rhopalosiphum padi]|uniref:uncharacterized protein LOC132924675 n=1 Tax=Rhopalosiphum padi TaxID=40932 RepID=UPI00298D9C93|nr:uncharacterized protein LOC132924675 [Rhopalosiphum padi]XP_060845089.1 uncharacterized protein LOC132924675 [Rhopalosiphum padi]XP_060845090.1 uncharacterized protein LOC132924675 [Rhopalosiphum padi]